MSDKILPVEGATRFNEEKHCDERFLKLSQINTESSFGETKVLNYAKFRDHFILIANPKKHEIGKKDWYEVISDKNI